MIFYRKFPSSSSWLPAQPRAPCSPWWESLPTLPMCTVCDWTASRLPARVLWPPPCQRWEKAYAVQEVLEIAEWPKSVGRWWVSGQKRGQDSNTWQTWNNSLLVCYTCTISCTLCRRLGQGTPAMTVTIETIGQHLRQRLTTHSKNLTCPLPQSDCS